MDPFLRHLRACNSQPLPGDLRPLSVAGGIAGWLRPAVAAVLATRPGFRPAPGGGLALDPGLPDGAARTAVLADAAAHLAALGLLRLRGEAFDVRGGPGATGRVLARLDRGALPAFGLAAQGVHLNGLVLRADGPHLWVARRSRTKKVAPGQLDNLVAGGVSAGHDAVSTLVKEAGEEAGLPPGLAAGAVPVGRLSYVMALPEGTRRDLLHVFDLVLPESFVPHPHDGEVEAFELWPLHRALAAVRDTDAVKFNVNLVLIDLFLRRGLIAGEGAAALRAGLARDLDPSAGPAIPLAAVPPRAAAG